LSSFAKTDAQTNGNHPALDESTGFIETGGQGGFPVVSSKIRGERFIHGSKNNNRLPQGHMKDSRQTAASDWHQKHFRVHSTSFNSPF